LILPATLGGFPIQFTRLSNAVRQFTIDLGGAEKIIVKTWHSMVSININSGKKHNFEGSLGLMGSFDNGQKIGRDNQKVFDNLNEFGLEWQVQEDEPTLFHNSEGPQAPKTCEIPSSFDMRRRLGKLQVSKSDAENACKDVHKEDFDLCVFDVIATNKLNVASSY